MPHGIGEWRKLCLMMKKKIDRMHAMFGVLDGKTTCKDCDNLISSRRDKCYYKCSIYGETSSEASDWRLKYLACGKYNTEYHGRNIIEVRTVEECQREPIDGQRDLFENIEAY